MNKEYILVVKTGEAEIRAIENSSSETLEKVFPIIELTRGRKKTLEDKREVFPFTNRLNRLKESLKGIGVAIDATSDRALTSPEIDELYEYGNGYEKWVDLVCGIKEEGCFESITPALMMNFDDPAFEDNLKKEIELLSEHIGFYSDKEWKELLDCIVKNNELSVNERRKIRADGFLSAGKYGLAMDEYEVVISKAMAGEDRLRAKAFHNLGVCAAKLFMYEKAAQYFAKAYEAFANTESYISMLSAMKLYMPSNEYLEYLSSHKESYEDSLEVERRFESFKDGFETQPIGRYLKELADKKSTDSDYYDGIESLTEEVKEEYRNQIYRGRTGGY